MTKIKTGVVNIGFGNYIITERIITILTPGAAPIKRLKDNAKERNMLIDATQGKKTRSIIILDSNHIILSGIQSETITNRIFSATSE